MSPIHSPQFPHPPSSSESRESAGWQLLYWGVGACLTLLAFLAGWSRFNGPLLSSAYMPHLYCYLGNRALVWSHAVTDSLIGISYLAISITIAHLIHRCRR